MRQSALSLERKDRFFKNLAWGPIVVIVIVVIVIIVVDIDIDIDLDIGYNIAQRKSWRPLQNFFHTTQEMLLHH